MVQICLFGIMTYAIIIHTNYHKTKGSIWVEENYLTAAGEVSMVREPRASVYQHKPQTGSDVTQAPFVS